METQGDPVERAAMAIYVARWGSDAGWQPGTKSYRKQARAALRAAGIDMPTTNKAHHAKSNGRGRCTICGEPVTTRMGWWVHANQPASVSDPQRKVGA